MPSKSNEHKWNDGLRDYRILYTNGKRTYLYNRSRADVDEFARLDGDHVVCVEEIGDDPSDN